MTTISQAIIIELLPRKPRLLESCCTCSDRTGLFQTLSSGDVPANSLNNDLQVKFVSDQQRADLDKPKVSLGSGEVTSLDLAWPHMARSHCYRLSSSSYERGAEPPAMLLRHTGMSAEQVAMAL